MSRLLIPLLFVLATPAHASKFANQFVEFELPSKWQCILEGAEWVCQSTDESKRKEAIIILAAKLKGDQDSLDQYQAYLKQPKQYTSLQGKSVNSEPKYSKIIQLNDHAWVDSLHLESEIPGFYTRYIATVMQDIGILVTYSINKDKYKDYLNEFETMVATLKAFRKTGGLNAAPANSNLFQNTTIPQGLSEGSVFPNVTAGRATPGQKKSSGGDDFTFYLLIAAVAGIAFFIWKKRRG
jgi:hypothetical protein